MSADYMNAPARTEFNGRLYTAEIQSCVPVDATDQQVSDFLELQLGFGSCDDSNPMLNADINHVSVIDIIRSDRVSYTDWSPVVDGRASGKTRWERAK